MVGARRRLASTTRPRSGSRPRCRHEHEAFRNFTGFGIRVGNQQKVASAEILYRNCLFENCGTALGLPDVQRLRQHH